MNVSHKNPIICWFSGGVTSAVSCKLAIDIFGLDKCVVVMIDTHNEDDDSYRFMRDCSNWYGTTIHQISNKNYASIEEIWDKFLSLNVANGAICSAEAKRAVRIEYQKTHPYFAQVFGFDIHESRRAEAMKLNYPDSKPIFPLLMFGYSKKDCINIIGDAGIVVPNSYRYGYLNNNCFKTMCVQGGIGYWQKVKIDFPDKYEKMAQKEHELTDKKGKPVTMLKDQSKEAKKLVEETGDKSHQLIFLKPHPDYPNIKDLSMMKGRPPKPLMECNGFCGIDDLEIKKKQNSSSELNFEE